MRSDMSTIAVKHKIIGPTSHQDLTDFQLNTKGLPYEKKRNCTTRSKSKVCKVHKEWTSGDTFEFKSSTYLHHSEQRSLSLGHCGVEWSSQTKSRASVNFWQGTGISAWQFQHYYYSENSYLPLHVDVKTALCHGKLCSWIEVSRYLPNGHGGNKKNHMSSRSDNQ